MVLGDLGAGLVGLGAALAIGLSGLGTGIAEGSVGSAAVGAVAEDPKMFGRGIVFMVVPETIILFGVFIAMELIGKF